MNIRYPVSSAIAEGVDPVHTQPGLFQLITIADPGVPTPAQIAKAQELGHDGLTAMLRSGDRPTPVRPRPFCP